MTTIHLLPEFVAYIQQEKLEVTKGVIRSINRRRAYNTLVQRQTTVYKTLNRKIKIEQHEPL
jgi:hypothetical protein